MAVQPGLTEDRKDFQSQTTLRHQHFLTTGRDSLILPRGWTQQGLSSTSRRPRPRCSQGGRAPHPRQSQVSD